MDKLVYLTYPALLILLAAGAKWYGKNQWNADFMSLKQTKYLQGFFAICIMLHHIGQETCAEWQKYPLIPGLEFFVPIGYFFVAFYLMCSGFGLFKSYRSKPDYLKGFFRKRILPLILAFYSTGLIFFFARVLMKQPMNGWDIFCNISGWGLPNPYAWYVVALPYFYLCFYLSFRFLKRDWMKISATILGVFLYTLLGTWIDHNNYWMRGEWWYNSVHLFWIGILFARFETQIVEHVKKNYLIYLIAAVAVTYVFFNLSLTAKNVYSYYGEYDPRLSHLMVVRNRWICLAAEMLASAGFAFCVLLLNMKMKIGNRVLEFMGTITLEFYLIHGLFLEFFSYQFCDVVPSITRIKNVALLIVVVLVPSLLLAVALKKLHGWLPRLLTECKSRCKTNG